MFLPSVSHLEKLYHLCYNYVTLLKDEGFVVQCTYRCQPKEIIISVVMMVFMILDKRILYKVLQISSLSLHGLTKGCNKHKELTAYFNLIRFSYYGQRLCSNIFVLPSKLLNNLNLYGNPQNGGNTSHKCSYGRKYLKQRKLSHAKRNKFRATGQHKYKLTVFCVSVKHIQQNQVANNCSF